MDKNQELSLSLLMEEKINFPALYAFNIKDLEVINSIVMCCTSLTCNPKWDLDTNLYNILSLQSLDLIKSLSLDLIERLRKCLTV